MSDFASRISGIGALDEPHRQALYLYVCAQSQPVGREEAAKAVGVPLHKAKFHLDRLVDEGLLETDFARPSGRAGPGAGRPAKRYRRSRTEVAVSLPERQYALAGELMAEAIATSTETGLAVLEALNEAATNYGTRMGRTAIGERGRPSIDEAFDIACSELRSNGYEPQPEADRVILANCPFHALRETHTSMVCAMNLALIEGLSEAIRPGALDTCLTPDSGRCCVTIGRRTEQDDNTSA